MIGPGIRTGQSARTAQEGSAGGGSGPPSDEFLSEIYARGLLEPDPTIPNTLLGSFFGIYFNTQGQEIIEDVAPTAPATAQDAWARRTIRKVTVPWILKTDDYTAEIDTGNSEGAMFQEFNLSTSAGVLNKYMSILEALDADAPKDFGWEPQIASGGPQTTWRLAMLTSYDSTIHGDIHSFNSDGQLLQRLFLPNAAFLAPHDIGANFVTIYNGGFSPPDGTACGYWIDKMALLLGVQDAYNSGTGLADSHFEVKLTRQVDGGFRPVWNQAISVYPGELVVEDYNLEGLAKLTLWDGQDSPVSETGSGAIRYNDDELKLETSVNGGAWTDFPVSYTPPAAVEDTAAADTLNFASTVVLSGTTQKWTFGGEITVGNTAQDLFLQPNSSDADMLGATFGGDGTTTYAEGGGSGVGQCRIVSDVANAVVTFEGRVIQRAAYRLIVLTAHILVGAALFTAKTVCKQSNAVEWTSIRIQSTAGAAVDGIQSGSTFWVQRSE